LAQAILAQAPLCCHTLPLSRLQEMSAAAGAQQQLEQQAVEFEGTVPGQQVQYVMQAPAVQGVVYAQAPQPVAYVGAQPAQYTYLAPPEGQVTYLNAPAGEAGQQVVYLQGQDGQQMHVQGQEVDGARNGPAEQFTYTALEGGEIAQVGAEAQQVAYYEASPARVNVSHEIFAKLAAGVQLMPEEMAQLSGQPAPAGPAVPGSPQAAAAGAAVPGSPGHAKKASGKKEKKEKSGEKKALKASKKKKNGCC